MPCVGKLLVQRQPWISSRLKIGHCSSRSVMRAPMVSAYEQHSAPEKDPAFQKHYNQLQGDQLRNGDIRKDGGRARMVRKLDTEEEEWQETLKEELSARGIVLPRYYPATYRILCPECDGGSTKELSLGVTIDETYKHAVYHCFRATCDWSGLVRSSVTDSRFFAPSVSKPAKTTKPRTHFQPLDEECYQFFESRGISREVLERNDIQMEIKGSTKYIAFPYKVNGEVVNVKYRNLHKKEFHQAKGAAKVFYGLDDVRGTSPDGSTSLREVIIVEGEMDKLALEMAGFKNVLSVPEGAPSKVKEGQPMPNDLKYSFMENSQKLLGGAQKIILATDNDACGDALAEELARRLGAWKCWRVQWPQDFDGAITPEPEDGKELDPAEIEDAERWRRKDANEVLVKDSDVVLRAYVENCEPLPVKGLLRFLDFYKEIENHYLLRDMCPSGFSTGWPGLDQYYKVVPGELTVVSGVPNSGKSEWLDAIAVHLAELYSWKVAFASMEKHAWDHGRMLIEKHVRKPFFENVHYAKGEKRMTADEVSEGVFWINDRFPLIVRQDDQLTTVDWILQKAKLSVLRDGIRGLIIDPYNEINHSRPGRMSETEFVSDMLTKIKRFAQTYQVHIWLVAHPRQLHDWNGSPPNLYDISGSAHFVNKADAGIVIHRNWQKFTEKGSNEVPEEADEEAQYLVRIIVRKMRNKAAGRVGECILKYNPVNGTYSDPSEGTLLRRNGRSEVRSEGPARANGSSRPVQS